MQHPINILPRVATNALTEVEQERSMQNAKVLFDRLDMIYNDPSFGEPIHVSRCHTNQQDIYRKTAAVLGKFSTESILQIIPVINTCACAQTHVREYFLDAAIRAHKYRAGGLVHPEFPEEMDEMLNTLLDLLTTRYAPFFTKDEELINVIDYAEVDQYTQYLVATTVYLTWMSHLTKVYIPASMITVGKRGTPKAPGLLSDRTKAILRASEKGSGYEIHKHMVTDYFNKQLNDYLEWHEKYTLHSSICPISEELDMLVTWLFNAMYSLKLKEILERIPRSKPRPEVHLNKAGMEAVTRAVFTPGCVSPVTMQTMLDENHPGMFTSAELDKMLRVLLTKGVDNSIEEYGDRISILFYWWWVSGLQYVWAPVDAFKAERFKRMDVFTDKADEK